MEAQFALLALLLGPAGVVATAIHGAFDIANLLALLVFGWLAIRSGGLPTTVARLAVLAAVLLLVLYFGRLTVLDPKTKLIKATALLQGLVVSPAFFVGVGRSLPAESRVRVA